MQLYVDTSVPADFQSGWDALARQTTEEKHGKPRKAEDGFAGSALLGSSFSPLAAQATAEVRDGDMKD